MPAVGNYIEEITKRIFDLHLYSTATVGGLKWTEMVTPGNRLERIWKPGRAASPFKRENLQTVWDLRPLRFGPASAPARPSTITYGTVGGIAGAPSIVSKLYTFQITVTHPAGLDYGKATDLEAITEIVLTAAGQKLALNDTGLSYVTGWGPLSGNYTERPVAPGERPNTLEQTILLPVSVTLKDTQITG